MAVNNVSGHAYISYVQRVSSVQQLSPRFESFNYVMRCCTKDHSAREGPSLLQVVLRCSQATLLKS